jgi:ketose-bisphosphate aldolase
MALAAFNVFDFDTIRAISDASAEINEQCYLQFSASTVKYYGAETLKHIFDLAVGKNRQYIILHLDHCSDLELMKSCVDNGWDSIMGDFSHLPVQQNIIKMLEVKKMIGNRRVIVEGELGQVAGVEDGHGEDGGSYVALDDVKAFVEATSIELLAIGIGNAHGFYQSTDSIDIKLLHNVHKCIPSQKLVLHGGTGIEPAKIKEMKVMGIEKINISTELKAKYMEAETSQIESSSKFNMINLVDCRYVASKKLAIQKMLEFK